MMARKSMERTLDVQSVCDGNMLKLVTSHADAIGVPNEYILFPTLSTVAGLMGNSSIDITDEWQERCSLWFTIVGGSGTKRSAALRRLQRPLQELRQELETKNSQISFRPVILDFLGETKAHIFTGDEASEVIGFFDDLTESVELLYDASGGVESRHARVAIKKSYDDSSPLTSNGSFSFAGFIEPVDFQQYFDKLHHGIDSRMLIAFPRDRVCSYRDLKVPMPGNTPSLAEIFRVLIHKHRLPVVYSLSKKANILFTNTTDRLQESLATINREGKCFQYTTKAPGHLVRLSCVLAAFRQALKYVVYHEDVTSGAWLTEISEEDVEAARVIMEYLFHNKADLVTKNPVSSVSAASRATSQIGQKRQVDTTLADMSTLISTAIATKRPRVQTPQPTRVFSQDAMPPTRCLEQSQYGPGMSLASPTVIHQQGQTSQQNLFRVPAPQLVPLINESYVGGAANDIMQEQGNWQKYESSDNNASSSPLQNTVSSVVMVHNPTAVVNKSAEYFPGDPNEFLEQNAHKIKKLLEYKAEFRITPSTCAQRHLMPPISKEDMITYDTQTKYPVAVAKQYLRKVAELGFGHVEYLSHPCNKRQSSYFLKYPYEQINRTATEILKRLMVTEERYNAAFQQDPQAEMEALSVPTAIAPPYGPGELMDGAETDEDSPHGVNLVRMTKTEPIDITDSPSPDSGNIP